VWTRGEGLQGGGGEEGKSLQKLLQKLGNLEIYGKVLRGS
jgi:peptidoglycan hydrolase-like protein with peptidoglycan-binding domain